MSCHRKQEFVGGAGFRVNVEFQDIPHISPLGGALWGSAYTGLLAEAAGLSAHHTPTSTTLRSHQGPHRTTLASEGEDWLLALIPAQPQNTQNKSLGRLKQQQTARHLQEQEQPGTRAPSSPAPVLLSSLCVRPVLMRHLPQPPPGRTGMGLGTSALFLPSLRSRHVPFRLALSPSPTEGPKSRPRKHLD